MKVNPTSKIQSSSSGREGNWVEICCIPLPLSPSSLLPLPLGEFQTWIFWKFSRDWKNQIWKRVLEVQRRTKMKRCTMPIVASNSSKLILTLFYLLKTDRYETIAISNNYYLNLPIATRQGSRTFTQHPISKFVSIIYPLPIVVLSCLSYMIFPKNQWEAMSRYKMKRYLVIEMEELKEKSWGFVPLPLGRWL